MASDERWREALGVGSLEQACAERAAVDDRVVVSDSRIAELQERISTLRTRLALREDQLRVAHAVFDFLANDLVAAKGCIENARPVVEAACRWRDGTDRGELAAAVDAYRGFAPLRPEQYADGAGAQAWRQAMGGKA